jgi:protein SCO1/2
MRSRAALIAGLAVFLAGAGILVWSLERLWRAPTASVTAGAPQPSTVGGPFTLTDQDGRRVTEKDFSGKPFLVFFGFTHCPDICPAALFEMSEVLNSLGPDASRTAALFVTVDPERDTPEVLKTYLSNFNPGIRGLTGTVDEVMAAAKTYRAYARKVPQENGDYSMDHTAVVYLMDKQGRFVAPFNLKRSPDEAAAELRPYL